MEDSTLSVDDFERVGEAVGEAGVPGEGENGVDRIPVTVTSSAGGELEDEVSVRSSTRSSVSRSSGVGDGGSFVGEVDAGPSESDLLRIMECPVCAEFPIPPIFNCENGHFTCNECLSLLTSCSLCESKFTQVRNYALESIIESTKFKCRYNQQGCEERIGGAEYRSHLEVCPYGPAICNEVRFTQCDDKIIERVNYVDHLYLCHNAKGVKFDCENPINAKRLIATFLQTKGDDFSPLFITSASTGQSFFVFTKKYKSFYCWWVAGFKPKDSETSIAKLTWSTKDVSALTEDDQTSASNNPDDTAGETSANLHPYGLQWILPIHSLKKPFNEIRDSGLCAVLPDTHMQPFGKTIRTDPGTSEDEDTQNVEWNLTVEVLPVKHTHEKKSEVPLFAKPDLEDWLNKLRLIFPVIALIFMIIGVGLLGAIYMKTSSTTIPSSSSTENIKQENERVFVENVGFDPEKLDDMKPYPHLNDRERLEEDGYESYRGFYYNRNQKARQDAYRQRENDNYGSGREGKKYERYGKARKGVYGSGAPEHDDEFVGYRGFYHQKNTEDEPKQENVKPQEQAKVDTDPKTIASKMVKKVVSYVGTQLLRVLGIKQTEETKKSETPKKEKISLLGIEIEGLDFVGIVMAKLFFLTFCLFCLITALVSLTMYRRWIYSPPPGVRRRRPRYSGGATGRDRPQDNPDTNEEENRIPPRPMIDDFVRRRPTSF